MKTRRLPAVPFGAVLGVLAFLVFAGIILTTIRGAEQRAQAAHRQTFVLEEGYAQLRNQISATGGVAALNGIPTVSQLLGGNIVPGLLPKIVTFTGPVFRGASISCSDPTQSGNYTNCVGHGAPPSPTTTVPKK